MSCHSVSTETQGVTGVERCPAKRLGHSTVPRSSRERIVWTLEAAPKQGSVRKRCMPLRRGLRSGRKELSKWGTDVRLKSGRWPAGGTNHRPRVSLPGGSNEDRLRAPTRRRGFGARNLVKTSIGLHAPDRFACAASLTASEPEAGQDRSLPRQFASGHQMRGGRYGTIRGPCPRWRTRCAIWDSRR